MKTVTMPGRETSLAIKMTKIAEPLPVTPAAPVSISLQWQDAISPDKWASATGSAVWDGSEWVFDYPSTLDLIPVNSDIYGIMIGYTGDGYISVTLNDYDWGHLNQNQSAWLHGIVTPLFTLSKISLIEEGFSGCSITMLKILVKQ